MKQQIPKSQPTKVWQSLVKTCPPQNRDIDFWWQHTGYQLSQMIDAAGYSTERQYEILLFHYLWIVPRFGLAPEADGRPKWISRISQDCSPLEYAWKWNNATSKPKISYSWEALNPGSDSCLNPKNHAISLEYMRDVTRAVPEADFTLSHHFLREIEQGNRKTSNFLHAIDFGSQRFDLKSYFIRRDESALHEWNEAITKLEPNNPTHHALMNFLENDPEGKQMSPIVIAWDNVAPIKSRMKWYFLSNNTSFKAVRQIMTMGGLLDVPEDKMQDLRSLLTTIMGLPADFPEETNFPLPPPTSKKWEDQEDRAETFAYYFDIASRNNGKPDVKLYLPTRSYGPDDLTIAHRLVDWMNSRGRGQYGDRYLSLMHAMAEHRGLGNGKGLQSYITYQVGKADVPDVKSYFIPETYHPSRFVKAE